MKVTKYDVITTLTLRDMIEKINIMVFRGWEPVGQIRSHIVSSVSTIEYETYLLFFKRKTREMTTFTIEYIQTFFFFGDEEEYKSLRRDDEKGSFHNRNA